MKLRNNTGTHSRTKVVLSLFLFSIFDFLFSNIYAEEVGRVVAVVNNEIITSKDLDEYCRIISFRHPEGHPEIDCAAAESIKKVLDMLIEDKLIIAKGRKEEVEVRPEVIERKLENIIKAYPAYKEFEDSLIEKGINAAILKERIKEQYLSQLVIEKYVRSVIYISPRQVSQYYEQNPKAFFSPRKYSLWIARSQDYLLLDEVGRVIENQGLPQALIEYGDLLVNVESALGDLRKDVAEELKKMDEGNYFIKDIHGVNHLIYLEGILPPEKLTLQEAKEKIHSFLWQREFEKVMAEWMSGLKKEAVIKVYLE